MTPAGGFLDRLVERGLLLDTGVDGLYGRGADFESVVAALDALATAAGADLGAEVMRFPPGMSRTQFERSGYLKGFPQLAGTVHCFCGGEQDHRALLRHLDAGEDWTRQQRISDVTLTPAACYPVYPILARRGRVPPDGATVNVASYCFRHEPSREPTRMQMFRMHEYVRIGSPEQVEAFREDWLRRGDAAMQALGLPHGIDVANDPFFGRGGKVLADSQREQRLKFEMLVPVNDGGAPTACLSFNYHMDHFGQVWDLRLADGSVAHTACVGFGLERLALALLRHHGLDLAAWPSGVAAALWPGGRTA